MSGLLIMTIVETSPRILRSFVIINNKEISFAINNIMHTIYISSASNYPQNDITFFKGIAVACEV